MSAATPQERWAIVRVIEEMIASASNLKRAVSGSHERGQVIADGYPSYLPDFDQFVHDLVIWRDTVRDSDPTVRKLAVAMWADHLSEPHNLAELNDLHGCKFRSPTEAAKWVVETFGQNHLP